MGQAHDREVTEVNPTLRILHRDVSTLKPHTLKLLRYEAVSLQAECLDLKTNYIMKGGKRLLPVASYGVSAAKIQ